MMARTTEEPDSRGVRTPGTWISQHKVGTVWPTVQGWVLPALHHTSADQAGEYPNIKCVVKQAAQVPILTLHYSAHLWPCLMTIALFPKGPSWCDGSAQRWLAAGPKVHSGGDPDGQQWQKTLQWSEPWKWTLFILPERRDECWLLYWFFMWLGLERSTLKTGNKDA
jgi:hypothetical protein